MPRETTFSYDDVVNAAYEIVVQFGLKTLSARKVAERLGSSTAPVYSYLASMQELTNAVITRIRDQLINYTEKLFTPRMDLNMGVGIVLFARDYPNLYRAIFMESTQFMAVRNGIFETLDARIKAIFPYNTLSDEDRRHLLSELSLFSHGLAVLACAGFLDEKDDDYIIYTLWEIGEDLLAATFLKMQTQGEYVMLKGQKVRKAKMEKLAEWRKLHGQGECNGE